MNKFIAFILLTIIPTAVFCEVKSNSINTQISYLNEGMPSAFKVGQSVNFLLTFETETSSSSMLGYSYANALKSFDFSVGEAGFNFSSETVSSILGYNSDTSVFSLNVSDTQFDFDGKLLVGVSIEFKPLSGVGENPLDSFASAELDYFTMAFYNPETKILTSGSVVENSNVSNIKIDFSSVENFNLKNVSVDANYLTSYADGKDMEFIYSDGSYKTDGAVLTNNGMYWVVSIPEPSYISFAFVSIFFALAFARRAKK